MEVVKQLNQVTRGWVNYFYLGATKYYFNNIDGWIRRKIRCYLWKQWKTSANRLRKAQYYCKSLSHRTSIGIRNRSHWYNSLYTMNNVLKNKTIVKHFNYLELVVSYEKALQFPRNRN